MGRGIVGEDVRSEGMPSNRINEVNVAMISRIKIESSCNH